MQHPLRMQKRIKMKNYPIRIRNHKINKRKLTPKKQKKMNVLVISQIIRENTRQFMRLLLAKSSICLISTLKRRKSSLEKFMIPLTKSSYNSRWLKTLSRVWNALSSKSKLTLNLKGTNYLGLFNLDSKMLLFLLSLVYRHCFLR